MSPYKAPLITLAAICTLTLAVGILQRPKDDLSVEAPAAPDETAEPAVPSPWQPPGGSPGEVRVSFSKAMPKGDGSPIVDALGNLDPAAVKVGVPNSNGGVDLLPGTDQRAIDYLASVQEEQERVIEDRGPRDVDTGGIPSNGAAGQETRSVRLVTPSQ